MLFSLITLLTISISLYKNLSIDRGTHNKAKLWLVVSVILLTFYYSYVFSFIYTTIITPEAFNEKYNTTRGFLLPWMNTSLTIIHALLSLFIIFFCSSLAKRKLFAKNLLMKILPIIWLIEALRVYRDFMKVNPDAANNGQIQLLAFILTSGIACSLIYLLYDSKFMKAYFGEKA